MNRTGLFIALGVAVVTGLVFGLFPELDVRLARLFYDDAAKQFALSPQGAPEFIRRAAMWIAWLFAGPALITPIIKLIQPHKPLLVPGRAMVFLLVTIFLTAIFLPNVIFKEHWGRPRPITTTEFNGSRIFKPWWDPRRGGNQHNGSFFSGEAATAFWTYAPAALAPPALRPIAFVAATGFGLTTGILRMAFGAHYASDIIAAGVSAFLVTWLMYGFIYRWKFSRLSDQRIDQAFTNAIVKFRSSKHLQWLLIILGVLTAIRFIALRFSVVDLFPDEARYWAWAQAPAFGYFSKPPLIAWIIAGASRICGNSECCIRAAAPLFYAATAVVTYFIARRLYDERSAFWTGLSIALATGTVFSARIISTDVPLLFLWALALLAYLKMLDTPNSRWFIVLGLALGFGLLAKYAMIYFLFCALLLGTTDRRARSLLGQRNFRYAIVIALIVILPNLVWNATHGFATFRHTGGNIVGSGFKLVPLDALAFIGSQFAVFGPIVFAVFLLALVWRSRFGLTDADRILIGFALPPLLLVTLTAFITSAKANWAAPAAISTTIVTVALLVRHHKWRWLQLSVAIGVVFQLVLIVTDAFADRVSVPWQRDPDIYRRTMGWKAMSNTVRQTAQANNVKTIAAEQNSVVAALVYYLRNDRWRIMARKSGLTPANQFELDRPLTTSAAEPILLLSDDLRPDRLTEIYSTVEMLPPIETPTGPHSVRRLYAFKLAGARRELAPIRSTH